MHGSDASGISVVKSLVSERICSIQQIGCAPVGTAKAKAHKVERHEVKKAEPVRFQSHFYGIIRIGITNDRA